jgi:hypothetical protein
MPVSVFEIGTRQLDNAALSTSNGFRNSPKIHPTRFVFIEYLIKYIRSLWGGKILRAKIGRAIAGYSGIRVNKYELHLGKT